MQEQHPMQPFIKDDEGIVRFKRNAIVAHLIDNGTINLNDLAKLRFSQEDRQQFAQLIGYNLGGYHELSYVSDESAKAATRSARRRGFNNANGCRDEGCRIHCGVKNEKAAP